MIIFITGGARSGKSKFAETLALEIRNLKQGKKEIAYIATSEVYDEEFRERIRIHRQKRSSVFVTYEENIKINDTIRSNINKHDIFLVECLTTWLGNMFYKNKITDGLESDSEKILNDIFLIFKEKIINKKNEKILSFDNNLIKKTFNKCRNNEKILIIVSNELGLGIIPENKTVRIYRDIHGRLNQGIVEHSNHVFFLISGIPLKIL